MLDLAQRVIEQTGSSSSVTLVPYSEAYGPGFEDMQRRVPSLAKVGKAVGWKPEIGLEEIVRSVVEYERMEH